MSFNVLRGRHVILPPHGHCRAMQAATAALVKAQSLFRVPLQASTRGNGPVPSPVGALEMWSKASGVLTSCSSQPC